MDADAKREKKKWLADQKAAARAAFPLSEDDLDRLFADVDAAVLEQGCDHSLRLTETWLVERNMDAEAVLEWLAENGGYCDCEVVANAANHFETNRR